VEAKQNLYGRWSVYDDDGPIIDGSVYPNPRDADQAALIAEAFNVAAETGRTPSQLAAERAELAGALEELRDELFAKISDKHDPKTANSWPEIQRADAILAKVKGGAP
jgi:hypothetical protein